MKSEAAEFLDHLAECADPADLPTLVAACAGRRVMVPGRYSGADNWIVSAIGHEKAEALIKRLNTDQRYDIEFEVPMAGHGVYLRTREAIRRRVITGLDLGLPIVMIAAATGITRRAVQRHKQLLIASGWKSEADPRLARALAYLYPAGAREIVFPDIGSLVAGELGSENSDPVDVTSVFQRLFSSISVLALPPPEGPEQDQLAAAEPGDAYTACGISDLIAAIARLRGSDLAHRIGALCIASKRNIPFGPRAIMGERHPFSAVLGSIDGRRLAFDLVLGGFVLDAVEHKGTQARASASRGTGQLSDLEARIKDYVLSGRTPFDLLLLCDAPKADVMRLYKRFKKVRHRNAETSHRQLATRQR